MPLTDHDVERRLQRNESDIVELYGICRDIQRVVRAHDRRFDEIDGRLDRLESSSVEILRRLDGLADAVGRLG